MFRIDNATAVSVMPPPGASGAPGFFTQGDPVAGVAATVLSADWLNMVQEELMSLVAAGAVSPNKNLNNQVLIALQAIFHRKSEFTGGSNQSITPNGFQRLPGGLILQWGATTDTSSSYSLSFPLVFPTACLQIVATADTTTAAFPTNGAMIGVGIVSNASFTLNATKHDGTMITKLIRWMAVGH